MHQQNEHDLFDFLRQIGEQYRERGKEILLDRCPICEKDRAKKSDHFSFNRNTLQYHCVKCNAAGNLITFKRELGYEPFDYKVYHKPAPELVQKIQTQEDWYYDKYQQARGIPAATLKKYKVGLHKDDRLGACRAYTYYDTDGTIANVKYVNAKKQMRTTYNAKKIYYGLQFLDYNKPELYVTEGEDDCHALASCGFENVVSVPYGAGNYSEEMGQINKRFKKIYLLFDCDEAGQKGAAQFAQKAGVWKCYNVQLPFKDCRDCLLNGYDVFDFQQVIGKAKKFEYAPGIIERPALTASERLDRYEHDSKNVGGITFGFPILDDVTGGLRGGDLLVIVANPGCYKTTLLMNLIQRAALTVKEGIIIFFSMEMPVEGQIEREIQILSAIGEPWKIRNAASKKDEYWKNIRTSVEETNKRVYVSEAQNITVKTIEEIIKQTEEIADERCVAIGIDYLDFIDAGQSREYEAVKKAMQEIKSLAKRRKIPAIVLCQTNRDNKEQDDEVGARSGKGGTSIEGQSDFQIGLWQSGERLIGRITKHRRVVNSFAVHPYFEIDIDRKSYNMRSFTQCERPERNRECDMRKF